MSAPVICHAYVSMTLDLTPDWWSGRLYADGPDVLAAIAASPLRSFVANLAMGRRVEATALAPKGATLEQFDAYCRDLLYGLNSQVADKQHRIEMMERRRREREAPERSPAVG